MSVVDFSAGGQGESMPSCVMFSPSMLGKNLEPSEFISNEGGSVLQVSWVSFVSTPAASSLSVGSPGGFHGGLLQNGQN